MIAKIAAFLRKNYLIESSYRLPYVMNIILVFFGLLGYFFINKLFGSKITPYLGEFGVDYFSYVLVSTAIFGYVAVGLNSFPEKIGDEQVEGTLEAILVTPTRPEALLCGLAVWSFIIATIDLVIYAVLGMFVFGIDFSKANVPAVILTLALTLTSFTGLGILSASFIILYKRGNPVAWLVSALEGLVGGVYFPVSVLPSWLQVVSAVFPITYAVKAIELAVFRGYGIHRLRYELAILVGFSAVLLPLSMKVFRMAIVRARKLGNLASY